MITPMDKTSFMVPSSTVEDFLTFIQAQGTMHLIFPPDREEKMSQTYYDLSSLKERLITFLSVMDSEDLPENTSRETQFQSQLWLSSKELISEINHSLDSYQAQLSQSQTQEKALKKEQTELNSVLRLVGTHLPQDGNQIKSTLYWIPYAMLPIVLREIESKLRQHKNATPDEPANFSYHRYPHPKEDDTLTAFSINENYHHMLETILQDSGGRPWHPLEGFERNSPREAIIAMRKRQKEIPQELKALIIARKQPSRQWALRFMTLLDVIDKRTDQLYIMENSQKIGYSYLIEGWVPSDKTEDLKLAVSQKFEEKIFTSSRNPAFTEYKEVPTQIKNNALIKPFEVFLKLVSLPPYGAIDPTPMIALFFPFFAGCIVGDVGYGLIMLLLCRFFLSKAQNPSLRDFLKILIWVALWSIFWGVLYGEYFGDLAHRLLHIKPLWVERSEAVMPILILAVSMGLCHVLLGLITGVVQNLRLNHKNHAIEKIGNIIVILALIAILFALAKELPPSVTYISLTSLAVGLALLFIGGGVGGLIESVSGIGNILSYVRIGAIGLSSAILAMVASKFTDVLGVSILGIFIAVSIHALNFVLAFAESSLHSARLHYVEFMGKFSSGQGFKYKPFTTQINLTDKN